MNDSSITKIVLINGEVLMVGKDDADNKTILSMEPSERFILVTVTDTNDLSTHMPKEVYCIPFSACLKIW